MYKCSNIFSLHVSRSFCAPPLGNHRGRAKTRKGSRGRGTGRKGWKEKQQHLVSDQMYEVREEKAGEDKGKVLTKFQLGTRRK